MEHSAFQLTVLLVFVTTLALAFKTSLYFQLLRFDFVVFCNSWQVACPLGLMATPEALQMMQVAAQAAQAAAEAAAALKQFAERDGSDRQKFSEASKVVKMPEVFGTEDHEADARNWRDFLLNFKSWLFYADKTFESGLSNVESNPKNVVNLAAMNEESKTKAVQLYAILTGLLKGKPLRLLRQQDDRNGLEVYRQLCQLYTPQSKTRALSVLQAFMQFPVFTKDKTLSEQILSLERLRSEYTRCSGQDLSDDLCLSVLVRCLPSQLKQHVQLQMQDTHTFNDIKNYALSYELTTSSWTTSKVHTELGAIPAPLPAGGPAPMEIDALTAKGKGKGKFKGKFDGKNGKGKKGGKYKSSGKGGKFQSSWQDRQQGSQGQLQSNQNSWQNHGGSWRNSDGRIVKDNGMDGIRKVPKMAKARMIALARAKVVGTLTRVHGTMDVSTR